jgi:ribosomal-protein-alanine N-acetyltransferase
MHRPPPCNKRSASVLRIRKIERADLDALFALDKLCFRPGIAYSKAQLKYFLRHPCCISCAAVNPSDQLLGFAIAESYLESGRRIGHIVTIDVALDSRRKGVGRLLMQAMTKGLADLGASAIRLEVAVDNFEAQAFYLQLGFIPGARISGFYMGTLDALSMHLPLNSAATQFPEAGDAG